MKKLILIILTGIFTLTIAGCSSESVTPESNDFIDYHETITLEASYEGKNFLTDGIGEVELVRNVDGDTAHFSNVGSNTSFSVRFLACNTPESTGKIEEWGKAASNYTATKLNAAETIVLQSSTGGTPDMTNDRYLGYVWVDGVLLNLELVVKGYAQASNVSNSPYNDTFNLAEFQAKKFKLVSWSGEDDPDFYYGEAEYATLKEVRDNLGEYYGKKIRIEGLVTRKEDTNAYIQYYDEEDDKYYGLYVFSFYTTAISKLLAVGNVVEITGILAYFDFDNLGPESGNGAYQLTDVVYSEFFPTEDNLKVISTGNEVSGYSIEASEITKDNPNLEHTFVTLTNLYVVSGSLSANGDMTIICEDGAGNQVKLRIAANSIVDRDGVLIATPDDFIDTVGSSTVTVSGIVNTFYGNFQVQIGASIDVTYN